MHFLFNICKYAHLFLLILEVSKADKEWILADMGDINFALKNNMAGSVKALSLSTTFTLTLCNNWI